ncbi:Dihydrolipoamide acetyltransferase component of pyruvate dehydrogenase complex [Streptomyces graminofaciens]|uniref:Dihydrolipoamide acetyltransferase component of pyruvate dehydrogenase complex n=1 Tax=Streptomyces graminofaciens TaxID=68212 RepID=A0ABM7FF94_9ACTN|nr:dihydrolipoamide acetyltransferase family protein [Streptomyces graminofaciens]BBC34750.1 Dihydrolipoamide acetyltransferase component of pyruvate dehydrogenase complex [Streptomyces graminofaciens]
MAQVLEFKLPDLGEGLTEAEIVRWLVQVGDVVAIDQPVVEVETAKAMVEVPCPYGGVVTARFGEEGTELPVGAPLLTVAVGPAAPGEETEGSGNVLVGYGTGAPPARRRRVRSGEATRFAAAPGGGSGGAGGHAGTRGAAASPVGRTSVAPAVTPVPLIPPAEPSRAAAPNSQVGATAAPTRPDGPVPVISPLVRRLARENGLDLRQLRGSGPDGLILRADVEHALRAATSDGATATEAPAPAAPTPAADVRGTRVPLRGVRGAVADKLSRSRREIPDATCWVDADATELMNARTAMNAAGGPKVSLLALLARICTAALARFPELNSTVDLEAREIVRLDQVHLGFAAQTERGLVVPVVRDAHARDAESLSAEFARLTEAARTGTLTPAQLTGGTFTLNNYGVFGVDGSAPIINHPEAAMLGVGRIVPKPWVHRGELAVRQVVQLSLTFDHRVCDGGTAGGFLRYVADCVEQPAVLLRTL